MSHRLGLTLGQVPVGEKTNEIPLAHTLLDGLLLGGRVLTMDALLTQRAIARDVVERGGDYLMVVKDNQPTGYPLGVADIALLFEMPGDNAAAMTRARSTDREHDRRERRALQASPALTGYLDWLGAAQVFRVDRRILDTGYPRTGGGEIRTEIVYGLTSLPPERADAAALLRLLRGHWTIENRLTLKGTRSATSPSTRTAPRPAAGPSPR